MSTPYLCPHCKAETPSDKKFCKRCVQSLLCPNPDCKQQLLSEAVGCVECGFVLHSGATVSGMNEFEYYSNQRGDNREVRAKLLLTDKSMKAVAPYALEQLITTQPVRQPLPVATNGKGRKQILPPSQSGQPALDVEFVDEPEQKPKDAVTLTGLEGAARYFKKDGEFLVVTSQGFKGTDWKQQQIRFVLMYSAAYEHHFGKYVPNRKHLTTAAQSAKVYDTFNFSKYATSVIGGMITEATTGLFVNDAGKLEVSRICAEMENPDIKIGYVYWSRATTDKVEHHHLSKEDKDKINEWAKEKVDLDQLDIISIEQPLDYALLAYWILTIHLSKAENLFWNEAYHYLKARYGNISATPQAFSRALTSLAGKPYFRTSDMKFFLSKDAIKLVESWRSGKPVKPIKASKDKAEQ